MVALAFLDPRRGERELLAEFGRPPLRLGNLGFSRRGDHPQLRRLLRRSLGGCDVDVPRLPYLPLDLRPPRRQLPFPRLLLLEQLGQLRLPRVRRGERRLPRRSLIRHATLSRELLLREPGQRRVRLVELRLGLGVHGVERDAGVGVAGRRGEHRVFVRIRGGVLGRLGQRLRVGARGGFGERLGSGGDARGLLYGAEFRGALAFHHREQRRLPLLQRLHPPPGLFELKLELHLRGERLGGASGGDLQRLLELVRRLVRELVLHLGEPRRGRRLAARRGRGRRRPLRHVLRLTALRLTARLRLNLFEFVRFLLGSARGLGFLRASRRRAPAEQPEQRELGDPRTVLLRFLLLFRVRVSRAFLARSRGVGRRDEVLVVEVGHVPSVGFIVRSVRLHRRRVLAVHRPRRVRRGAASADGRHVRPGDGERGAGAGWGRVERAGVVGHLEVMRSRQRHVVGAGGGVERRPERHVADARDGSRGGRAGLGSAGLGFGLLLLLARVAAAPGQDVGEEHRARRAERERREDAGVDALVRIVLTGSDVRLALSLGGRLGLLRGDASLLLVGGGFGPGRFRVLHLALPPHLLLSLGLDRRGFSPLRRLGLVLLGLLLRFLRRGGRLGVGSEPVRPRAFLRLFLRELCPLRVRLRLGVFGGGDARSLGAVQRRLLLGLLGGRLVHLGLDARRLLLPFLRPLRVTPLPLPSRPLRLLGSFLRQPLLGRLHLLRHLLRVLPVLLRLEPALLHRGRLASLRELGAFRLERLELGLDGLFAGRDVALNLRAALLGGPLGSRAGILERLDLLRVLSLDGPRELVVLPVQSGPSGLSGGDADVPFPFELPLALGQGLQNHLVLALQRLAPVRQRLEPLVRLAVGDPALLLRGVRGHELVHRPRQLALQIAVLLLERVLLDPALPLQVAQPELEVEVLGLDVALELATLLVELLTLRQFEAVHLLLALLERAFALLRSLLSLLNLRRDGLVRRLGLLLDGLSLGLDLGLGGLRRLAPLALLGGSLGLRLGGFALGLGLRLSRSLCRRFALALSLVLGGSFLLLLLLRRGALGGALPLELAFRAFGRVRLGLVGGGFRLGHLPRALLEPSLGGGFLILRGSIRQAEVLGDVLELVLDDHGVPVEELGARGAGRLGLLGLPRGWRGIGPPLTLPRGRRLLDRLALGVLGDDGFDDGEYVRALRGHPRRVGFGRRRERVGDSLRRRRLSPGVFLRAALLALASRLQTLGAPGLLLLRRRGRGERRGARRAPATRLDHLAVLRIVLVDAVVDARREIKPGASCVAVAVVAVVVVVVVVLWRAGHGDANRADRILRHAVQLRDRDGRHGDRGKLDVHGRELHLWQLGHGHLLRGLGGRLLGRGRRWLRLGRSLRLGRRRLGLCRGRRGRLRCRGERRRFLGRRLGLLL
mmetsp:Transcript_10216/g.39914  ORF Transcript_10216/g.39914 Transcript_10216/m.39914 type:complete len:1406 (-) Transcript_10216:582-4799(-)